MAQKTPARLGQRGTGAVAHEQADTEGGFQRPDACTDRRLRNMQARSGLQETAIGDHGKKCSDLFQIHLFIID